METNSYNPFFINPQSQGPQISYNQYGTPRYHSSAPAQPGAYGPNQLGIGYTSPSRPTNIPTSIPQQQQPEVQGTSNFGQYAQGAMAGFSAGMSTPLVSNNDFSIDPFAGYKASGQGFIQGGAIGAIVGGITGQYRNFSRVNKNLKNLNTNVDGVAYTPDGMPIYQGANVAAAGKLDAQLAEGMESIDPKKIKSYKDPINPVLGGIFGTRKKLRNARGKVQSGMNAAVASYNEAATDYATKKQAEAAYRNSQFELFNNSLSLPQSYSPLF